LKFASIGFTFVNKNTAVVLSFVSSITKTKLMKNNVWFVTGASKGLGLSLVKKLLQEGYRVAATSRNVNELEVAVGVSNDQFLPLAMNLLDETDVEKTIKKSVDHFGRVDVVVNNAGYGQVGGLEELTDAEARANFDVNVFGALNVIRKALPYMRRQRGGHIFNIASVGGFVGTFPGFGIYCATKFAMHGFTESLAEEVKPFGIQATIVSPGYFRTNFLDSSSLQVPVKPIEEYKLVRESQSTHQFNINGKQMGDPEKAASVLIEVAEMEEAPLHLFLGADAYEFAEQKMNWLKDSMLTMKDLATATAFEADVVEK
jgi:NAD(P)-dependent dehydrogenase (short-subunit alcohol dehydrogenase family)